MQAEHALSGGQALADGADRETRAIAGENGIRARTRRQVGEQRALDVEPLGDALDHQVDRAPVDRVEPCGYRQSRQAGLCSRADGREIGGDPCRHRACALRVGLDHGSAAVRAREHHGHVGAHGAATDHHGVCGAGSG